MEDYKVHVEEVAKHTNTWNVRAASMREAAEIIEKDYAEKLAKDIPVYGIPSLHKYRVASVNRSYVNEEGLDSQESLLLFTSKWHVSARMLSGQELEEEENKTE